MAWLCDMAMDFYSQNQNQLSDILFILFKYFKYCCKFVIQCDTSM